MSEVIMYSSPNCPYCVAAKKLLADLNVSYQDINIQTDDSLREKMIQLTGRRTVPQIIIDGKSVGGFDDLTVLHKTGELGKLLSNKE